MTPRRDVVAPTHGVDEQIIYRAVLTCSRCRKTKQSEYFAKRMRITVEKKIVGPIGGEDGMRFESIYINEAFAGMRARKGRRRPPPAHETRRFPKLNKEIIPVRTEEINGVETTAVNSREIHTYIGSKTEYAKWAKRRLGELGAVEGEDYLIVKNDEKGHRPTIDYIVTTDIAKHLGMMERNDRGKEIRDYFIEMEKRAKLSPALPFDPTDVVSVLDFAKQIALDKKRLEDKIEEDRPLVSFAKTVEASVDAVLIGNYAKLLSDTEGVKIGQNRLFDWLRAEGYLITGGARHNVPYQKYIDNGYFEVTTQTFAGSTGAHQKFTTKITGKGQIALAKKIVDAFRGAA